MRISEEQARKNREKVVAKASRLFRERGFDGVSVNDLMKVAGFTHGGFYNHFGSKEQLVEEALDRAFKTMDAARARTESLDEFITGYLSEKARDAPGSTCPAAALAGEVARHPGAIRQLFADGLDRMITSVADRLPERPTARGDAIDLVCRMLGALVLARAMPASSSLGSELLATATERCLKSATDRNEPVHRQPRRRLKRKI